MGARRRPLEAERRREALLDAAHRAFVELGYERTSLDAVIAEVGGSRRNIYVEFGGKEGLLAAVVERIIARVADEARERLEDGAGRDGGAPRDWLVALGTEFVRQMVRPDVIAVLRQLIALGGAGDAAERLWRAGPERFRAALEDRLRREDEAGRLAVADPARVAALLPDLMRGSLQIELLVGRRERVTDAEVHRQVVSAVDLLLPALAPGPR